MSTPSRDVLIEKIIDIGSKTGQFSASRGNDTDLVIERKIIDAEYNGDSGRERMDKMYKGYILLDQSNKEARYNEEITETSGQLGNGVSSGNISFGTSKSFFKGKTFGHKEFGKTLSFKKSEEGDDNTQMSGEKARNYSFDVVKQIRAPIEEILAQNGWKLSLVISKKDISYDSKEKKEKKRGWFKW